MVDLSLLLSKPTSKLYYHVSCSYEMCMSTEWLFQMDVHSMLLYPAGESGGRVHVRMYEKGKSGFIKIESPPLLVSY